MSNRLTDHVHLFVSAPPRLSPASIVNIFKGFTRRRLRQEFPSLLKHHPQRVWTRTYYVGTAGNVSAESSNFMDYLDILKSSKEEADHTPQEVIRAELSKKFPPDVRKIYDENLYELWHGDALCEYAGIDYDDTSDENVNKINAGYISLDHWVHTEEGGGRIISEACHMFDLFNYFTDSEVENVHVSAISPKTADISSRDNFTATLKYHDGSVCNFTYTALGAKEFGKEYIEIYADQVVLVIDDFKTLDVFGSKVNGIKSKTSNNLWC